MAGKKNPNLGDKLRQEREGAENTLRDSRNKAADSSTGDSNKKKAEHRRQIRHEADLAKMRSKKLKSEQEVKAKKNAAASGKKGGKPKKPGNLAADALSAKAHQSVRNADQDNNSGVEAAHFTEGSAEGAARAGSRFQYGRKLRQYKKLERLEKKADKDAVDSIFTERMKSDPQAASNFFSRWRQKQAIKKEYAAAKAGAAATENTAAGTAKAAQGTASITEKAFQFVQSHSHIIIGIAAVGLLVLVIAGSVSSCSVLINGGGNVVLGTSYTAEDEDLKGVETDYTKLEDKLRKQIDRIESDHPGYDEYRYNLAEIGHNPYELASLLTVEFENYTRSQVQARLQSIFEAQYELKLEEKVEIRTRKETRVGYRYNPITGTGHTYTYQVTVQYEYTCIEADSFQEKIWCLPASDLLGVGRATEKVLSGYGIHTIGELAATSDDFLKCRLGKNGLAIKKYANGLDDSPVMRSDYVSPVKSIGHGITTMQDLENNAEVWCVMLELVQEIGTKLRAHKKKAGGIAISIRNNELYTKEWQCRIGIPTQSPTYLAKTAFALFAKNYQWEHPIRSVTVRAINLFEEDCPIQYDLFTDVKSLDRQERLDAAIEQIRFRFGKDAIKNGVLFQKSKMPTERKVDLVMPTGMIG